METKKATSFFVYLGRIFFALAFLALVGAWLAEFAGGTVAGLSQQHLFNDAIVLSLFGIGMFLDALWHSRNV
jgi:hypothetical protein